MQDTARANGRFQLRKGDAFSLWRTDPTSPEGWSNTGLGAKPCALIDLLMRSDGPVSRERIADHFWGAAGHSPSRNSLRQALFRIRAWIGSEGVTEVEQGLVLTSLIERHPSADGHSAAVTGANAGPATRAGAANGVGAAPGVATTASIPSRREQVVSAWLGDVWQLVRTGVPSSAWLAHEPGLDVRAIHDGLATRVRADGGNVVVLAAQGDPGYAPFVLERELAAALLSLPGAESIGVGHRAVLAQGMRGAADSPLMVRLAILELFRAVSRMAPLLLVMEEPARYSTRALQELVSRLAVADASPMLMLLIGRPGTAPVSPVCLHPPQ